MSIHDAGDTRTCVVLVNSEARYSLWLQGKEVPPGWSVVGCLAFVKDVRTDMRPLSLRGRPEASRAS